MLTTSTAVAELYVKIDGAPTESIMVKVFSDHLYCLHKHILGLECT